MQYFRQLLFTMKLELSKFHHDVRLRDFLRAVGKTSFRTSIPCRSAASQNDRCVVYGLYSPRHRASYVGATTRGLATRADEHTRNCNRSQSQRDIPCYKYLRRHGVHNWIPLPLVSFADTTSLATLKRIELQLVTQSHSTLNTPYINRLNARHMDCKPVVATTRLRTRSRPFRHERNPEKPRSSSLLNSKEAMGSHCSRAIVESYRSETSFFGKVLKRTKRVEWFTVFEVSEKATSLHNSTHRNGRLYRILRALPQSFLDQVCQFVTRWYTPSDSKRALRRINDACKNRTFKPRIVSKRIRVDWLPLDIRPLMMRALAVTFRYRDPTSHYIIHIQYRRQRSVLDLLSNERHWSRSFTLTSPQCTCGVLESLGFSRDPETNHVSCRLEDHQPLCDLLPEGCGCNVKVLRGVPEVLNHCLKELGRSLPDDRSRSFAQGFFALLFSNHAATAKNLPEGRKHCDFVHSSQLTPLRQSLNDVAVISTVDKNKSSICVSCPHFRYSRPHSTFLMGPDYRTSQITPETALTNASAQVRAIVLPANPDNGPTLDKAVRNHRFGSGLEIPKDSSLCHKSRPLMSYYRHFYRAILGYICVAGLYLISRLKDPHMHTTNPQSILSRLAHFNYQTTTDRRQGKPREIFARKTDVANFYNTIPRPPLLRALVWLMQSSGIGRRRFLCVTKNRYSHANAGPPQSSGHVPGHGCHRLCPRSLKNRVRVTNSRHVPKGCFLIPIESILDLIQIDLGCAFFHIHNIFVQQWDATPQGAPASPFYAILTAVFIETQFLQSFSLSTEVLEARLFSARWIDDCYLLIATQHKTTADRLFKKLEHFFTQEGFTMKLEPLQYFAPFMIIDDGFGSPLSASRDPVKFGVKVPGFLEFFDQGSWKPRLQGFFTARSIHDIRGVIKGQILRTIDHSSCQAALDAVLPLMVSFLLAHKFPPRIIRQCLADVSKNNPNLHIQPYNLLSLSR